MSNFLAELLLEILTVGILDIKDYIEKKKKKKVEGVIFFEKYGDDSSHHVDWQGAALPRRVENSGQDN